MKDCEMAFKALKEGIHTKWWGRIGAGDICVHLTEMTFYDGTGRLCAVLYEQYGETWAFTQEELQ